MAKNETRTLRKGKHFLNFTFNQNAGNVRIFENWDGHIQNRQEEQLYCRLITKVSARRVWKEHAAKGYTQPTATA